MISLIASPENKNTIFDLWEKTLNVREIMRKESKSATEIIERFPRFLDYNGDMVIHYFLMSTVIFY